MTAAEFVERLDRAKSSGPGSWKGLCPAHDDRAESLSIAEGDDGRVLLRCFAGCKSEEIVAALNLSLADLFEKRRNGDGPAPKPKRRTLPAESLPSEVELAEWRQALMANAAALDRAEELKRWTPAALRKLEVGLHGGRLRFAIRSDGELVNVISYSPSGKRPKSVARRGRPRGLFPAPESVEGNDLWLVEGEPDAVAGATLELPAVAVPGVQGWKSKWAERFAGRGTITICFDCDKPGRAAAARVSADLVAAGVEHRVVDLDPKRTDGFDLGDLLVAAKSVAEAREELVGLALEAPTVGAVEPAGPTPDTAELLDATAQFIQRFVVLPSDAALTLLTLFVAHTHTFDAAEASPYVLVVSPEKRSGKTRLLEVLTLLVRRPWPTSGPSPTALYRTLADRQSCLLLDELDALLAGNGERTEGIREVLNAGNRPGFPVGRFNASRGEMEHFETFSPKVLAGIDTGHRIPDTVRDRGLTIHMQRKTGAEPVERMRLRKVRPEAEPLRQGFEHWAAAHVDELRDAEPDLPPELNDRLADGAEPLLAVAQLAGDGWLKRARAAVAALADDDDDDVALGALLLAALRDAFGDAERMRTAELLDMVNADETLPFGGFGDGGLDSRGLARLLKPYGIRPKKVRIGDDTNHRGYEREQFRDAWKRWSPHAPEYPAQAAHPARATSTGTQKPLEQAVVPDVPDVPDNPARAQLVPDEVRHGGCPSHRGHPRAGCRYCEQQGLAEAQALVDAGDAEWLDGEAA